MGHTEGKKLQQCVLLLSESTPSEGTFLLMPNLLAIVAFGVQLETNPGGIQQRVSLSP